MCKLLIMQNFFSNSFIRFLVVILTREFLAVNLACTLIASNCQVTLTKFTSQGLVLVPIFIFPVFFSKIQSNKVTL